jgi:23S rRNA (adenine2030-N6)-methyltransferase
MKYRHRFHAGNFADVHKHVAVLSLLGAMQRKDKGFLYLETHAGAGSYDLAGPDTHRGAEARHGVGVVLAAPEPLSTELKDYRDMVGAMRRAFNNAHLYPGSPWLAAQRLRRQDRGICWELLPGECRSLERSLSGFRRMRAECGDGYGQLGSCLPPRERRCLLLIDPPYESPAADKQAAIDAVRAALHRLANAVIALWYPIKDERTRKAWLARVESAVCVPTLDLTLWVYPRDSRAGLNGSGLLIFNPPYQAEQRATLWQAELLNILDRSDQGGQATRWLIQDKEPKRADA